MRRIFARASLEEIEAFNRTWFAWRLLPGFVRRGLPSAVRRALARLTKRIAPGLAPFPIARSPLVAK
jgi:hypothetical protein